MGFKVSSSPRNAINSDRCSAKAEHFCFCAHRKITLTPCDSDI